MIAHLCESCGRFRKLEDVVHVASDDETWTECVYCMSDSDLKHFGMTRKSKPTDDKESGD